MAGVALFLLVLLTSFRSPCFAIRSLVHLHVGSHETVDGYTIDFRYGHLFDVRGELVKEPSGAVRGELHSEGLSGSLRGRLTCHQNTGEERACTGSAEGQIGDVQVFYSASTVTSTCPPLQLWHSVTTKPAGLVVFSSNLTGTCVGESNELDTVTITIDLRGSLSPHLETQLHQIFVFEGERMWEQMTMNNSLLDIRVNADWPDSGHGFKRAVFNSHHPLAGIPSFVIDYVKKEGETVLRILDPVHAPKDRSEL